MIDPTAQYDHDERADWNRPDWIAALEAARSDHAMNAQGIQCNLCCSGKPCEVAHSNANLILEAKAQEAERCSAAYLAGIRAAPYPSASSVPELNVCLRATYLRQQKDGKS